MITVEEREVIEALQAEGYQGSELRVRLHFTQWNKNHKAPALFLLLEFEPGKDAQVIGEAIAIIAGVNNGADLCHVVISQ